jgi:hypothetical protein
VARRAYNAVAVNWFLLLKYIHVLLAITAVGANITYAVWGARAGREPEHLGFALRGIKFLDDRVANPCYGGLLVTGLIMAGTHYSFTTRFVEIGIGLFILLVVVAVAFYSPALKGQIETLDAGGAASEGYRKADARATAVGIPLAIIALLIVFDMVVKPSF